MKRKGLFALAAIAMIASASGSQRETTQFDRSEPDQQMHLDVGSEAEAQEIRRAIVSGWSRGPLDDVYITRMADEKGRPFWCVKLDNQ
jgi:hypothetical protein